MTLDWIAQRLVMGIAGYAAQCLRGSERNKYLNVLDPFPHNLISGYCTPSEKEALSGIMDENLKTPSQALTPTELVVSTPSTLQTSIAAFSPALASYLSGIGLPTQDVLSPVAERRKIVDALANALDVLSLNERAKAYYLTRFTVAVSVGLFDGALTYLWDETVKALRRLVANFDLAYFYSVAEQISSRNKNFHSEEDLTQVADHDLLEACRRIGLLSDVNYKRLEHVNYMRNHASAAHPNENQIDGYEMLGLLTSCLKHAITATPQHSVIQIKMLLENIRTQVVPPGDATIIGEDIAKLGTGRIDDLLWTIFGIYVDRKQTPQTRANIELLAPYAWPAASEDRKYEIGAKYGTFRKNADIARKDAAERFLAVVKGSGYKDEDSLAGELIDKLGNLKTVHYGYNNFYHEYAHAKILGDSLPLNGLVPRAARGPWVKVICTCFIGNGLGYREGVDESAALYYKNYIGNFTDAEIVEFLFLFADAEFSAPLPYSKCDRRTRSLAGVLLKKSQNVFVQRALQLIIQAPQHTLGNIWITSAFQTEMQNIPKPK